MAEETERVICPKCGERNLPESEVCWQCGQPLRAEVVEPDKDQQPSEPVSEPAPTPVASGEPVSQQPTLPPPAAPIDNSQTLVILGFVFAGLSLLCCPIFPIASIVMGIIANSKGNKLGTWVIAAGVVMLLLQIMVWGLYIAFITKSTGYMPGHMNGMHGYGH